MKKYLRSAAVLVIFIFAAAFLSGCATVRETPAKIDLPEAEKMQNVLDSMSKAVLAKNREAFMQAFSETCLQRDSAAKYFEYMKDRLDVGKYSQTITKARRIYGGTVCTVQSYCESQPAGKKNVQSTSRDVYFIFENGSWKIADNDYYPLANPYVVAGSDSILYDSASRMSESLSCNFAADTDYLQTYGDVILIGTPYDNASILDMEERDLTSIKVTEDYPGDGMGVVQVIPNVDSHRFVIIIQGSSSETAKSAVEYMTSYLTQNQYINTGVYFISDNKLKKADSLELTTLTTLDPDKAEERLDEAQGSIEANIAALREDLQTEQEQLLRAEKNLRNPYLEDYYKAFMGEEESETPLEAGIAAIPANFTDSRLCSWAFSLPSGNNAGTVYSYSRFMQDKLLDFEQPYKETPGLFSDGNTRKKTAAGLYTYTDSNWKLHGDPYSIASFNTAFLRLLGFSQDEAFSCLFPDKTGNFISTDSNSGNSTGFMGITEDGTMKITQKLNAEELNRIENDTFYVDFSKSAANIDSDRILKNLTALDKVLRLEKEITRAKAASMSVPSDKVQKSTSVLYGTDDIYEALKDSFLFDEGTKNYTSFSEAKAELRSVMGQLLAVKNTGFIINAASAYPGSQYDYARFASGLANVEFPAVYAQASAKSKNVQEAAKKIAGASADEEDIIQQLLQLADSIKTEDGAADRFAYPDIILSNQSGTPMDKALLLYGIYKNIYPDSENAYVAVGTESAYLVFEGTDGWKYVDCRDNLEKSFASDDIYLCFNEVWAYNSTIELGSKPDFMQ